jgi:hypothetical protein
MRLVDACDALDRAGDRLAVLGRKLHAITGKCETAGKHLGFSDQVNGELRGWALSRARQSIFDAIQIDEKYNCRTCRSWIGGKIYMDGHQDGWCLLPGEPKWVSKYYGCGGYRRTAMQTKWFIRDKAFRDLLDDLLQDVCDLCADDISPDNLRSKRRGREITKARRVAICVMRQTLSIKYDNQHRPEQILWNRDVCHKQWGSRISQPMLGHFFGCDSTAIIYYLREPGADIKLLIDAVIERVRERYPEPMMAGIFLGREPESSLSLGDTV